MFTGIVEEVGTLQRAMGGSRAVTLHIAARTITTGLATGDSVAVNGVCLTVTDMGQGWFSVDVMPETMRRTNIGRLQPGSRVNLQRSLRLGDRLGGHFVTGHVDGTGSVVNRKPEENATMVTIEAPPSIMRYIIPKGSVAVDGVSLTVVDHTDRSFRVSIIPHTAAHTTLGAARRGTLVNLEADFLGKYVDKLLAARLEATNARDGGTRTGLTVEFLARHGFAGQP